MSLALDTLPLWFAALWAGVIGLAMGSFFTVAAWRWPREESLVHPRSHCPACQTTLRWFELVPVFSWLVLRGRCRTCGAAIPVRDTLVELAGAVVAGVATAVAGGGLCPSRPSRRARSR